MKEAFGYGDSSELPSFLLLLLVPLGDADDIVIP
jgi:hypothetical protein